VVEIAGRADRYPSGGESAPAHPPRHRSAERLRPRRAAEPDSARQRARGGDDLRPLLRRPRRAVFAVFEAIAIVAVLVSVASTAYYAIALLHRDTAITNSELVETALPLVVAAVLLILISIAARLRGATQRIVVLLPLVLVAVVAAIELASSGIALDPDAARSSPS
jgi:hypothetical protein